MSRTNRSFSPDLLVSPRGLSFDRNVEVVPRVGPSIFPPQCSLVYLSLDYRLSTATLPTCVTHAVSTSARGLDHGSNITCSRIRLLQDVQTFFELRASNRCRPVKVLFKHLLHHGFAYIYRRIRAIRFQSAALVFERGANWQSGPHLMKLKTETIQATLSTVDRLTDAFPVYRAAVGIKAAHFRSVCLVMPGH